MQRLPSQRFWPTCLTHFGISWVLNSSRRRSCPSRLLKPTIIIGTPSKNDWAQNFKSFRSKVTCCWYAPISSEVFSSTQFIGEFLSSGRQSHTTFRQQKFLWKDAKTSYERLLLLQESCWHLQFRFQRQNSIGNSCQQLCVHDSGFHHEKHCPTCLISLTESQICILDTC